MFRAFVTNFKLLKVRVNEMFLIFKKIPVTLPSLDLYAIVIPPAFGEPYK